MISTSVDLGGKHVVITVGSLIRGYTDNSLYTPPEYLSQVSNPGTPCGFQIYLNYPFKIGIMLNKNYYLN
jgi:hypothetical protein